MSVPLLMRHPVDTVFEITTETESVISNAMYKYKLSCLHNTSYDTKSALIFFVPQLRYTNSFNFIVKLN